MVCWMFYFCWFSGLSLVSFCSFSEIHCPRCRTRSRHCLHLTESTYLATIPFLQQIKSMRLVKFTSLQIQIELEKRLKHPSLFKIKEQNKTTIGIINFLIHLPISFLSCSMSSDISCSHFTFLSSLSNLDICIQKALPHTPTKQTNSSKTVFYFSPRENSEEFMIVTECIRVYFKTPIHLFTHEEMQGWLLMLCDQLTHEELASKQLSLHKCSIFWKAYFIGSEFHPLYKTITN